MATETTAWDDLLSWQQEINEKDQQLLRTRAMREASSGPVQELRQIDLATAQPVGLSSLKDKVQLPPHNWNAQPMFGVTRYSLTNSF
jgi:hypothetical protein